MIRFEQAIYGRFINLEVVVSKRHLSNLNGPSFNFNVTVDFHSYYLEDAIGKIDQLILDNEDSSIMIVHGNGDGVLRTELRKYCKDHKFVKEVLPGEKANLPGGFGVTVIYTV